MQHTRSHVRWYPSTMRAQVEPLVAMDFGCDDEHEQKTSTPKLLGRIYVRSLEWGTHLDSCCRLGPRLTSQKFWIPELP